MSGSGGSSLLTVAKIGCFDVDLSCELMRCGGWFAQRSAVSLIHGIYIYIYIFTTDSIPRMTENEKSEFFEPKNQQKINEIVEEKKKSNRRIQCIVGTKITPQIEEIYLMICDQRSELEEK